MGLIHIAVAQQPTSQIIGNNAPDNGLLVIIADQNHYESVATQLTDKPVYQPLNVLLINGTAKKRNQLIDTINYALNHVLDFKKEMAYLAIVSDSAAFIDKYSVFENDFFATQLNLCNCSDLQNGVVDDTPNVLQKTSFYHQLQTNRRFHFDILDLERQLITDKVQPEISKGGIGLGVAPNIIWQGGTDAITNTITQISLYRYVQIKKKWSIRGEIDFSLNKPNPQDEIRSMVQSQLDFSSIINGDDQIIDIDITVQGHGYLHAGIHAEYEPFQSSKWRTYVGLGVGFTQYLRLEVALDTSFVIEGGNFSPGSGGFDFGGDLAGDGGFGDASGGGLGADELIGGVVFPVSMGIRTELSPRWEFDTRMTGYYYSREEVFLTSMAIQVNLAFRLWKKEQNKEATLPYLRLR